MYCDCVAALLRHIEALANHEGIEGGLVADVGVDALLVRVEL